MYPQFRKHVDTPSLFVGQKIFQDCQLASCVIKLTHWPSLDLPVYVLSIGLVRGAEVNLDRNMRRRCRHGAPSSCFEDNAFHTIASVLVSDFDFELPEQLIAQQPPAERGASHMLILDRQSGAWQDSYFDRLPASLQAGDVLVLNDSRVIPARLFGVRQGANDGKVEVLLTEQASEWEWRALTRPARRMTIGREVTFPGPEGDELLQATVVAGGEFGR